MASKTRLERAERRAGVLMPEQKPLMFVGSDGVQYWLGYGNEKQYITAEQYAELELTHQVILVMHSYE